MFYSFRPYRNSKHPGDGPPKWGPLGKTGCPVLVIAISVIIAIAFLIGATRSSGEANVAAPTDVAYATTTLDAHGPSGS